MKFQDRNGFYQRIDGSKYRNIYVVGDLHGCYNRLMTQLSEIKFEPSLDLLISVGDLIDRGPQSLQCLELIREPWFKAVKGNHEEMAIQSVFGSDVNAPINWFHNGGNWFFELDSDTEMHAKDLIKESASLPYVIELDADGRKTVVAHADYPKDCYQSGADIDLVETVWSRDRFNALADGGPATGISGADQFFFGHTPISQHAKAANLNYIDTGAVFGGALTIVQVQGGGDAQAQAEM